MRVKFPEGSGGPFLVPGVGPVNGGEEFDWPDDLPPVAGAVPVDGEGKDESPPGEPGEPGEDQPAKGRARSSKESGS